MMRVLFISVLTCLIGLAVTEAQAGQYCYPIGNGQYFCVPTAPVAPQTGSFCWFDAGGNMFCS